MEDAPQSGAEEHVTPPAHHMLREGAAAAVDGPRRVVRMDAAALPLRVLEGTPQGRRPAGQPKLRWRDYIQRDLEMLAVPHPERWMEHAQDRRWWRSLAAAAKDPGGLMLPE